MKGVFRYLFMNDNNMIPKVIHYFWFGKGEKPPIFFKCLESWKKNCPDYEIKEWTEDSFDININAYVKEAYQKEKYAFVSDYARFYVLYNHGGIYLDIDVEILKSIDKLLSEETFMGFEDRNQVNPGLIMGARKGDKLLRSILDIYDSFDGYPNDNHNVCKIVTEFLVKNKQLEVKSNIIQRLDGITVFPIEYFCACDYFTKKMSITENTYTVHHYNGSWLSTKDRFINRIRVLIYKAIGRKNYDKLKAKLRGK